VTRAKRAKGKDRAEAEGATQMMERQWEFAGCLFRSERDMYRGIVEEWLTSSGLNNERDVLKSLASSSDAQLVDELLENWPAYEDEEPWSRDKLIKAMQQFRSDTLTL
jgi:hypothetical protein